MLQATGPKVLHLMITVEVSNELIKGPITTVRRPRRLTFQVLALCRRNNYYWSEREIRVKNIYNPVKNIELTGLLACFCLCRHGLKEEMFLHTELPAKKSNNTLFQVK